MAWIWLRPLSSVTTCVKRPSVPAVARAPAGAPLMSTCTRLPACAVPVTVTSGTRVALPEAGALRRGASGATWATLMLKLLVLLLLSESNARAASVCAPLGTASRSSVVL